LDAPYLITVHDLIRHRDCDLDSGGAPLIRRPTRRDRLLFELDHEAIRDAAAVIAISETTRRDVIEILGVPSNRVHVAPNGIDHARFRPTDKRVPGEPYVLFVGVEHPRKNLRGLLAAFARLKRELRCPRLRLIKIGPPGYRARQFRRQTLRAIAELGLEDDVHLVGRVEDALLPAYYSGAECLVMPSLYEGFGLPVIEAMACGCPVVASDRGALPEVVADAGLVSSPDEDSLAASIWRILGDPELKASLRGRGLARAARFTWDAAARQTQRIYRRTLEPI
jgi:glycosyltransferase involved in cell wall biosynthesis